MTYRNWCFTLNNYSFTEAATVLALPGVQDVNTGVVYICYGQEVGENGTPHLQGYIEMAKQTRLSGMKKIIPRAHFEQRRGTQVQAIDYCKKDGKFFEAGEKKEQPDSKALNWDQIWADTVKGDLEAVPAKVRVNQYTTLKKIAMDHVIVPEDLTWDDKEPPNEWIYGPTGTGKSRTARLENKGFYYKMNNKWWENYDHEEIILIEDVGKTHEWMGDFLKIWADRYGFRAEIKNLSIVMRPKKIVVTSNYSIRELWSDPSIYEPLERRFKLRPMAKKVTITEKIMPKLPHTVIMPNFQGRKNCLRDVGIIRILDDEEEEPYVGDKVY